MKHPFLIFLLFLCGGFSAVAQPSGNPLVFGENRLTLITPTLFRLEFAHDGKFIDDPTYFAYDRGSLLPASEFRVRELGGNRYEISTSALRIVYEHDGFPFGLHNFAAYYKLNGKEKKFTNRCIFRNNLGGPVETLDRVTGEIPMQDGLLSRDGWYVIDDERSDLLVDGWLRPRDTRSHVQDQYCFVYGNDYKAALADLGAIGGRVPMTRKYIHGVWYCRYWDYTSEEFLSIIDGYEQNDFPLDNLVFDMGWHTYTARTGTGHAGSRSWTGYTWERKRIPDPGALIAEVHRRGVTVSLNDHPHDGIRPHEEMYAAFMADMGADPAHPLLFDLGDRKYMETFFKHAHHASEDMGADFWWLDWQQNYLYPEVRGYRSTSLQWINELYYRETERKGLRGAGCSRWAGGRPPPSHPVLPATRRPAGRCWLSRSSSAASGNAGCYYWAHDIGGFRGDPNPELTVRWTQFEPVGRPARALDQDAPRPPSVDQRRTSRRHAPHVPHALGADALRLQQRLADPFDDGAAEPPDVYRMRRRRTRVLQRAGVPFRGPALPLPSPRPARAPTRSLRSGCGSRRGCLVRLLHHERFDGGRECEISKPLEEFPLYVREAGCCPCSLTPRPASTAHDARHARLPLGRRCRQHLYALRGRRVTRDYEQGAYATTQLNYPDGAGDDQRYVPPQALTKVRS
ncbi:MAG: TIM-barrel domain-containing protein [Alistipes sp.]